MRKILLLVICLLGFVTLEAKDDYRFRNLTMNDGLAANTVRNIVQDKNGYVWFGTDNGLCRYDGRRVLPLRIPELGINQYISALQVTDEGLFVGTAKGVFFIDYQSLTFLKLPLDIHTSVTSFATDKDGALWISTLGQGVWQYNAKNKQHKYYNMRTAENVVSHVMVDNRNQIWTLTNWGAPFVQRLNRLHNQFEPVTLNYPDTYNGLSMLQTRDGRYWLGTWEHGLLQMHSDGRLEQVFGAVPSKMGWHIHTLYELADGRICIGCDDGLIIMNPKTGDCKQFDDRFIYAITSDTEGGMWIGTFYNGVKYISPVGKRFEGFSMADGLTGNVISRFCEDKQGRLWIASDDGGLMCYQPKEQRFSDYPHRDILKKYNVHALCLSNNELWVGTYTNGIQVLNLETGQLRHYPQNSNPQSLDVSSCYALFCDKRGWIWAGTMESLNLYNRAKNQFECIANLNSMVIDIDEDWAGNLWISTQGNGLWKYHVATKKLKQYKPDEGKQHALPDYQVNCCLVDEAGKLWVGTLNGLCSYTPKTDGFAYVDLNVPNQNVMGIIEDQGALWLSTERGIVRYEPTQPHAQRFTRHDGLVSEQFQPNAGVKTKDGCIYFGSTAGFNSFYPYQIKANSVMPPVYVTSLEILNREERNAEGHPIDLTQTKQITIGYSDSKMITLSYASLSYCSPEKIEYAYMLEGFDRDWNYVGNQNRATYTNLPAGTYTFRVKATNNDGIWSDNQAELIITVEPPFWWSWYARLFYLVLLVAGVYYYVQLRLKRAERQHQQQLQQLNEQKEKEVREARLNFFTMIAHEIRTPVSLIIGPLEKLMKQGTPSADLKVIDRNAHRLLELVNQLLDFRKVEQQSLVMHFAPHNIYQLMVSVSERFAPTFEQNGKRFTVAYPDEHFTAIVDKEAIIKTISNLLTNANKYTKDEVQLSCSEDPDGEHLRISVSDNGVGIRQEDQERIFQPFFQAEGNKPGTGIGLNIVKNIVNLHHGTISVESELGKGSTFTIVLPISQADAEVVEVEEPVEPTAITDSSQIVRSALPLATNGTQESLNSKILNLNSQQSMLIVDDSEDMRQFLESSFSDKYTIITAGDGIEALHLLQQHQVSIIISDWMMPRMDGAEFCRRMRQNPLTSHIPFVMLTAKTDDDSKVEGMDVGADTYIEKPFSVQYLQACIRNILQIRRQLMEKFSTQPLEPVTEIAQNATDNEFLTQMKQIIEENFSNSELNVDFLAERLNISRSGLFAKIKSLADVTPNEMIQIVRLKRAAQLLHEGGHMVSEVGYMVGFSNPSYFSKCFQKQFGIRPADYMKQK